MRLKRHDTEVFSMSFLDCICCGFGAIILLLVLTEVGRPKVLERQSVNLQGQVLRLQQELYEIRGETDVLNRDLQGRIEQLSEDRSKLARLQGDLTTVKGEYAASRKEAEFQNIMESQLVSARQHLTEEMTRLLASPRRKPDATVGGIPVDSEYVVFVIDTSGSMQENHWAVAQKIMQEILDIYPRVKGVQVMNDMAYYLFSEYAGKWIPDSPARRKAILDHMRHWEPFSMSSPVVGIQTAVRTFWAPDKKVSIYYLGDDFTGDEIQPVLDNIDRFNKPGPNGERLVRIHAIGFPMPDRFPQYTAVHYASLMRAICERNGGTFVGLLK
jgi:hypothetical protein